MINRIMIDTSILIEYIKNTKTKLLIDLVSDPETDCCICETVLSEYFYYFLALNGGRSPRATQSAKEIYLIFEASPDFKLVERFDLLPSNEALFPLVPSFMKQYNLLPNDAIILANCKIALRNLQATTKISKKPAKLKGSLY